jgi:hypothetical protein
MTESELRSRNPRIKIIPVWIVLLDKLNLPRAIPFLETLFTKDCLLDVIKLLEVHQPMNSCEALNEPLPMLINSSDEIVGDTDVKRAANPARQDVNPIAPFNVHRHFTTFAELSIFTDDATEPGTLHP